MSITTPLPAPEPNPEDISRGLAAFEKLLADEATSLPSVPAVVSAPVRPVETSGETKRVRDLRAEVAEARLLADLQDDETPLFVDSPKVRKRRQAAHEAARLHELAQDPDARAWQAARMRRLLVTVAMVVLTLALGWSTAGVQVFASEGADPWTPGWVFAWFVEPFLSLGLLFVVGARAYMATQGQPLVSPTLARIEHLLLALTLGMNAWPHLPGVAATFTVSALVLHLLGPIVAVIIVTALPIVLAAFTGLDHGSAADLRWTHSDAPRDAPTDAPGRRSLDEHRAELHRLIDAGQLHPAASARAIQAALRCRAEHARTLRKELAGGVA